MSSGNEDEEIVDLRLKSPLSALQAAKRQTKRKKKNKIYMSVHPMALYEVMLTVNEQLDASYATTRDVHLTYTWPLFGSVNDFMTWGAQNPAKLASTEYQLNIVFQIGQSINLEKALIGRDVSGPRVLPCPDSSTLNEAMKSSTQRFYLVWTGHESTESEDAPQYVPIDTQLSRAFTVPDPDTDPGVDHEEENGESGRSSESPSLVSRSPDFVRNTIQEQVPYRVFVSPNIASLLTYATQQARVAVRHS